MIRVGQIGGSARFNHRQNISVMMVVAMLCLTLSYVTSVRCSLFGSYLIEMDWSKTFFINIKSVFPQYKKIRNK